MRFVGYLRTTKEFLLTSKLLRANYIRNSLVLYCVEEVLKKEHFLQIMADAINDY